MSRVLQNEGRRSFCAAVTKSADFADQQVAQVLVAVNVARE